MRVVNVIGNGDSAVMFNAAKDTGLRVICNVPPFEVNNVYACCIVDFKMMQALTEGSIKLDNYQWVLGTRPQMWMQKHHQFYLKHSAHIREFYTTVPEYAENATNFNCGHMAVHYSCVRLGANKVRMFGFDSIFDHNMRSLSDLILSSDRTDTNNYRLLNNWRPIWHNLWKEFPQVQFELFHRHDASKVPLLPNVKVNTSRGTS